MLVGAWGGEEGFLRGRWVRGDGLWLCGNGEGLGCGEEEKLGFCELDSRYGNNLV